MVNLTIDDKQISVENDATVFEAAQKAGIRIPVLCHDKKLYPYGGCRMCLVEVEQMKGRLIPACTTPVSEGMIVHTSTDEIINARKLVLELLLLKHPLDCPVCDKAGECDLQDLTYEYKVNKNPLSDEKFHWEIDYNNPLIERDQNRCIHCGKCARICDEIVSFGAYSFVNRGIEAKLATPFDGPLNCEYCGSCISVCPVGALLSKPFKFKARWWSLTETKTVCSYCGTGCQLTLGVKDNEVMTTVYDEDQGFHNGQLCIRGRFGYTFVNHEERLLTPLVRKNGELVAATWDEAIDLIIKRFSDARGNSIAGLITPRLTNEELFLFRRLFKDVLKSDNIDHSAGYAHSALTEGLKESLGVVSSPSEIADIQKSDMLLVIKTDAYETHPVIGFEINLAVKRKDVDLRIISDKKGKLAKLPNAKLTLHKPGNELPLVNAIAKIIIDENLFDSSITSVPGFNELKSLVAGIDLQNVALETGVSVEHITELARDYAKAEKALILLPIGLGYPGHTKKLAQALTNIAILTGKLGKEGSGILVMGEKNNSQGAADLGIYPTDTSSSILDKCLSGEIKSLYIVGENPLVAYPNRAKVQKALDSVDFIVAQDLFLTETASKADVVLPACSFAEKNGTFTSIGRIVQKVNKAIDKLGESKSDFEIFLKLISELTKSESKLNTNDVFKLITETIGSYSNLTLDALGEEGEVYSISINPKFVPVNAEFEKASEGSFALLSGSALYHCGTMSKFGVGPSRVSPDPYVEFGKSDASKLGITDGSFVKVKSDSGEIKLKAKVGLRMPQGVLFAPYHFTESSLNNIVTGEAVTWVTVSK